MGEWVWAIPLLALWLGQWYDMRSQMAYLRAEQRARHEENLRRFARLERRHFEGEEDET